MSKKINFSVSVIGDEKELTVTYSDGMKLLEKYALVKFMLTSCFHDPIENVSEIVKNNIIEKMINDARKG